MTIALILGVLIPYAVMGWIGAVYGRRAEDPLRLGYWVDVLSVCSLSLPVGMVVSFVYGRLAYWLLGGADQTANVSGTIASFTVLALMEQPLLAVVVVLMAIAVTAYGYRLGMRKV